MTVWLCQKKQKCLNLLRCLFHLKLIEKARNKYDWLVKTTLAVRIRGNSLDLFLLNLRLSSSTRHTSTITSFLSTLLLYTAAFL